MNENPEIQKHAEDVVADGKEVQAGELLEGLTQKPSAREKRAIEQGLKKAQAGIFRDLKALVKDNKPQLLAHIRLYGSQNLEGLILSKYFNDIKKILTAEEEKRRANMVPKESGTEA